MLLFIYSLNSFSIFTVSLLNSKSIRLQRSVSLLTALGEFSGCFNWEWFLSFFILFVFFFFVEKVHSPWPCMVCTDAAGEGFLREGVVFWPSLKQQGFSQVCARLAMSLPLRGRGCFPRVGGASRVTLRQRSTSQGWV